MIWPSPVDNTNVSSGTTPGAPAAARLTFKDLIDKFNQLINHVSALGQSLLGRSTAALMRADLGSTSVGDAVFTATTKQAAQIAIGVLSEVAELSVASAATMDIGAATVTSGNVLVTGSVAITSFGVAAAGTVRNLRFVGAPLLTYNASTLVLPGGANIQAAAGDCLEAESLGSGAWVVRSYTKADGKAVVAPAAPVTSVNGQTGAVSIPVPDVSTGSVMSATSGASALSVGAYSMARLMETSAPINVGGVYSGSSLVPVSLSVGSGGSTFASPLSTSTLPGTWRAMNGCLSSSGATPAALFLRIA